MSFENSTPLIRGATRITRRGLVIGGTTAAASSAFLSGAWNPRRSMARQASGDLSVRIFPFGPGVEDLYASFKSGFESENPGVNVTIDLQPWDNRYPKLLADIAADQGPDVFFITTDALIRFAEANAIAALPDLVPADVWSRFEQRHLDEVSVDGVAWFVPQDLELPLHYVNVDLIEQAGLDPAFRPETWDDIRTLSTAVKEIGDPFTTGWGYNASSATLNDTFYPLLHQAGGRPISEDGTEATFNSEAGVEALSFVVELFDQGWVSEDYLSPIDSGQDPFTLGGQALSNFARTNSLFQLRINNPDLNYAISPLIAHKERLEFGGVRSWAISEGSQQQELAGLFLEYLSRSENEAMHSELGGTFPANVEARSLVFVDDPEVSGLVANLEFTFGEQKHKYGRDLMPLVLPEIQAAIIGEKEPQQALDDAATAVKELFEQG